MPLRTYQNYEADTSKTSSMKYMFMLQKFEEYGYIDEVHGILTIDQIKDRCATVFREFPVEYCYLFESYATGKATEISDVDLLFATDVSGINFYDLVEAIRESLQKKVDILNHKQLLDNPELINGILKDGVDL